MTDPHLRDLIGYGRTRPHAAWPGNARVAVSFVLSHEEGAERSAMDGDPHAEICCLRRPPGPHAFRDVPSAGPAAMSGGGRLLGLARLAGSPKA